jgi:hypothetical protein
LHYSGMGMAGKWLHHWLFTWVSSCSSARPGTMCEVALVSVFSHCSGADCTSSWIAVSMLPQSCSVFLRLILRWLCMVLSVLSCVSPT